MYAGLLGPGVARQSALLADRGLEVALAAFAASSAHAYTAGATGLFIKAPVVLLAYETRVFQPRFFYLLPVLPRLAAGCSGKCGGNTCPAHATLVRLPLRSGKSIFCI